MYIYPKVAGVHRVYPNRWFGEWFVLPGIYHAGIEVYGED